MWPQCKQRVVSKPASAACCRALCAAALVLSCCANGLCAGSEADAASFHKAVRPILQEFCFDCHSDGANKGNVAFDEFKSDAAILENQDLWLKALKNLRAGL